MKISPGELNSKAWTLGLGSALMIVSGYYGELVVTGDLTPRWGCWFLSMVFFLYIVYELMVGCHRRRRRRVRQGEDQGCTAHDRDQLVHLPSRLPLPNAQLGWCNFGGCRPAWILRV